MELLYLLIGSMLLVFWIVFWNQMSCKFHSLIAFSFCYAMGVFFPAIMLGYFLIKLRTI